MSLHMYVRMPNTASDTTDLYKWDYNGLCCLVGLVAGVF